MKRSFFRKMLVCGAASLALSACGGGESGVSSMPTPPPSPPPPPPPASTVHIFDAPETQEYTVLSGFETPPLRFRYDSTSKVYEVSGDTFGWTALVPTDQPNTNQIGSYQSWVYTDAAYSYSAIVEWDYDQLVIGSVTPEGHVPISGSATYQGVIQGYSDTWDNGSFPSPNPVGGTVALSFDFGAGSLSGAIHPTLFVRDGSSPSSEDLGVLNFKDTVFSRGGTNFSGAFDTNLAGPNSFSGRFTGPNAEELMGAWTLPFIWSRDDGLHSASGGMIGKR